MSATKNRRRFVLPLLVSTGLLSTAGLGTWHFLSFETLEDSASVAVEAEDATPASSFDAVVDSWGTETAPPSAPVEVTDRQPATTEVATDPFQKSITMPAGDRYAVTTASYDEPAAPRTGDRYSSATVTSRPEATIARGQSPNRLRTSTAL
ncbi:MAG: hypothetical protein AAGF31_04880, partial [Planctomycetota bacterium]